MNVICKHCCNNYLHSVINPLSFFLHTEKPKPRRNWLGWSALLLGGGGGAYYFKDSIAQKLPFGNPTSQPPKKTKDELRRSPISQRGGGNTSPTSQRGGGNTSPTPNRRKTDGGNTSSTPQMKKSPLLRKTEEKEAKNTGHTAEHTEVVTLKDSETIPGVNAENTKHAVDNTTPVKPAENAKHAVESTTPVKPAAVSSPVVSQSHAEPVVSPKHSKVSAEPVVSPKHSKAPAEPVVSPKQSPAAGKKYTSKWDKTPKSPNHRADKKNVSGNLSKEEVKEASAKRVRKDKPEPMKDRKNRSKNKRSKSLHESEAEVKIVAPPQSEPEAVLIKQPSVKRINPIATNKKDATEGDGIKRRPLRSIKKTERPVHVAASARMGPAISRPNVPSSPMAKRSEPAMKNPFISGKVVNQ